MQRTIPAVALMLLTHVFSFGTANALVGADVADRIVQRYTVVIASAKGRCSGVLLAQDIVLTAGHCIQPGEKFQVGGSVGGGERNLQPSLLSPVEQIVVHPLYKPTDAGSPDLAMLKLARPLPDRFIAATLNARGLSVGDDLIAAGRFDRMVAWQNRRVVDVPLADVVARPQQVAADGTLVRTARGLGICLVDR